MWRRWDPHIHTPGTILNNQFKGHDAWDRFLQSVEQSDPPICALGITDYLSIDSYERVRAEKHNGRLRNVGLLFPNVEMRFGIATARNSPINFHLLASPDDPNHTNEIRRFLLGLTFNYLDIEYRCERADLIRLGYAFDKAATEDHVALRCGTGQFKVNYDQFQKQYSENRWAQENILIAVSGGSQDGTSGVQDDASFSALRRNLERAAHIIFSSQPSQRRYWLGKGKVAPEELARIYGGRKPCLHGSDAHDIAGVGRPAENRYCWIKGDMIFESLRQACLEPESRAFIGGEPPRDAMPSQVISKLEVTSASWLETSTVLLNPRFVAIIGARGSGKTALADLIAAGGFGLSEHINDRSFIKRAAELIGDAKSTLTWGDDSITENVVKNAKIESLFDDKRVQYLSQQFVDQLCSSEGLTDTLVEEVERVVFQAHTPEARMGATSFTELLELKTSALRSARSDAEAIIASYSENLISEQAKRDSLDGLRSQRKLRADSVATDRLNRQSLIGKGQSDHGLELERISNALTKVRSYVDAWMRRQQNLLDLRAEFVAMQQTGTQNLLQKWKDKFRESGLNNEQWGAFLLKFADGAEEILNDSLQEAARNLSAWKGPRAGESIPSVESGHEMASLIGPETDINQVSVALLSAESSRLRKLVGIDADNARKYNLLSDKIAKDEVAIAKLDRDIDDSDQAKQRIADIVQRRSEAYKKVFQAIMQEEEELRLLYAPLKYVLDAEGGTLGKLGFSIRRVVDVESWTSGGESLFDLRAARPFRGRGSLRLAAQRTGLISAWEKGSADEVTTAMACFRSEYGHSMTEHCNVDRQNRPA